MTPLEVSVTLAKFLTAVAGCALIVVGQWAGYNSALYVDCVAILTALGVWATPNHAK